MKSLEQSGLLKSEPEERSTGRPKIKYFITELGENKLIEIRQDVEKYFKFLKENSIIETDFDIPSFLEKTFNLWTEPVERIIYSDISITGKIKALSEVEDDLLDLLAKVRKEKSKLKKKNIIEKVSS
jgi:DNA-binding PadR family transcriptional regulator